MSKVPSVPAAAPVAPRHRPRGLGTVLLGTAGFYAVLRLVAYPLRRLLAGWAATSLRAHATTLAAESVLGELVALALLVLLLRRRGRSLRDLGLSSPAPPAAWIAAALLTALFVASDYAGPLRGVARPFELSLFRVGNGLAMGLVAGVVEETVFRGWVMTELAASGWGRIAQVVASGLLFGAAHAGWGGLGGHVDPRLAFGAAVSTSLLGAVWAGLYLLSRRSLMPAIASHAAVDLLIEPWLLLAALTGALGHAGR